jgi:mannosyltransferase
MTSTTRLILILVVLFGVALRLFSAFHDPSLWLDEAFSAKLAESPLQDLLLAVPRFDTHPPLYYVQLHVWGLFGDSDSWMILNSVVIDILVIMSLVWAVGRIHGASTGLWSAAVYAVLPLNVFFAENLRMYAMFFLLVVWLWYMLERRVIDGTATKGARIGTILLGLATTLTHGLGFFVVFFVYLQALVRIYRGHQSQFLRPALLVVLDYVPVALAALYSLGIGTFRQTEGVQAFDLEIIGIHLTISLFGMEVPAPAIIGYLGFLLVLVPPVLSRPSRPLMLWLVILPFATLLFLSLTVKAVFMYRTLGLFSPFLAIALGLKFAQGWAERRFAVQALSAALLVLFSVASVNTSLAFRKEGFRDIAAIWTDKAPADAVLFVEGTISLWGLTRYLEAAPTYSALDIQAPVRDGMLRVKERLAGTYLDRAGLFGISDHLVVGSQEIWPYVSEPRLDGLARYWVLSLIEAACLRPQDSILQSFIATGQKLVECQSATAEEPASSP